jgi:hypothetical protein
MAYLETVDNKNLDIDAMWYRIDCEREGSDGACTPSNVVLLASSRVKKLACCSLELVV